MKEYALSDDLAQRVSKDFPEHEIIEDPRPVCIDAFTEQIARQMSMGHYKVLTFYTEGSLIVQREVVACTQESNGTYTPVGQWAVEKIVVKPWGELEPHERTMISDAFSEDPKSIMIAHKGELVSVHYMISD